MDDTTRNNTPLVPENHVTVYSRYSNHHSSDYIFTSCDGFLKPFIEANPWNGEVSLEALDSRAKTSITARLGRTSKKRVEEISN